LDERIDRSRYFARDAGYSDFYATQAGQIPDRQDLAHGEKEMMLADVVLGRVIEMDRNITGNSARTYQAMEDACRQLKAPPAIAGCTVLRAHDGTDRCVEPPEALPGDKYNTVRGYTQTDIRQQDGTWTKNPSCPSSEVHIVCESPHCSALSAPKICLSLSVALTDCLYRADENGRACTQQPSQVLIA
jgi:hypothetical protein